MNNSFNTSPNSRYRRANPVYLQGEVLLDRYKIISLFDKGRNVYRCVDKIDGHEVSFKVFSFDTPVMIDYWEEKITAIAGLHHPNIIAVKKFSRNEASKECYLIAEYTEGENLRDWIKNHNVSLPQNKKILLSFMQQLAQTLDFLHARNIVHGDIKPDNILITPSGHIKIIDFDFPCFANGLDECSAPGTLQYMSPEHWLGEPLSCASDQYSLAVMVCELFFQKFPFHAESKDELRRLVMTRTPDVLQKTSEKCSSSLLKALDKDPEKRYANCQAFIKEFSRNIKTNSILSKFIFFIGLFSFFCILALILIYVKRNNDVFPVSPEPPAKPVPAVRQPESKQIPAVRKPVPKQIPAVRKPESKQIPAVRKPESKQIPAVRQPVSKQIPAAQVSVIRPESGRESYESALAIRAETGRKNNIFYEGENLTLDITANKDCYILVYVKQSDGSQIVLFPNFYNSNNKITANVPVRIPGSNRPGFKITVTPPWGKDNIFVSASTQPNEIFDKISREAKVSRRTFVQTKGLQIASYAEDNRDSQKKETAEINIEIETRPR